MAKVPVYNEQQVDPSPLRAPQLDSVVSPALLGEGARQQAQLGGALMKSGGAVSDMAVHMQDRENADSVLRAEVALKDAYIKQEQDWTANRKGRFAKDLTLDANKWFDEETKKHSDTLGNAEQRRIFAQRTAALRESGLRSVSRFETAETERSHDEALEASIGSSIGLAAQTPTTQNIEDARANIVGLYTRQAGRKGWEPEVLKDKVLQKTTALHENVIKGMAVNDPVGAAAYFETHKKEIDGKRHDELGKFAKDVSANAIGDQVAGALWGKHGPKTDNEPVNLDEMETKVREALKGNDVAVKAAISSLRERTSAFDKGVRERAAANAAAVSVAAMRGDSLAAIRAMPEFQKLDGTKQAQMLEHIETTRYVRGQRNRAQADQADADLARKNNAAYLVYSDPNVLKDMTRNQVLALLPSLGRTYTEHLLQRWDSLEKGGAKVLAAQIDADDFNHVAQGAGLRPFDPKKTEEEKAMLGELKYQIEQRIDQEQVKLKRPLTRAEKLQLFQQEMDNKVLVDRMWPLSDPSKPSILLTPKERADAYVVVENQRVKLADIPDADRAEIIATMKRRSFPVSEEAIARVWLKARGKSTPATTADRASSSSIDAGIDYAKKGGKALAAGWPDANAATWGVVESFSDLVAGNRIPTPMGFLMRGPAEITARAAEGLRHEQEAVTRNWRPDGEGLTEQSVYGGLQSMTQNALTLPLSVLTGMARPALLAMSGLTFGRSWGEFMDAQVVPKEMRTQIEAALKQSKLPVTEQNIRELYGAYLQVQQLKKDPGAAGP
jgi:hypothetical protein